MTDEEKPARLSNRRELLRNLLVMAGAVVTTKVVDSSVSSAAPKTDELDGGKP